jgi:hypothetical protein
MLRKLITPIEEIVLNLQQSTKKILTTPNESAAHDIFVAEGYMLVI